MNDTGAFPINQMTPINQTKRRLGNKPPFWHVRRLVSLMVTLALASCSADTSEDTSTTPVRHFVLNETMIEDLATGVRDTACDPTQVLPQLLAQIGPEADIYPSENYYYFSFNEAGSLFSGSLRLASDRRDDGIVDYVCYETYRPWLPTGGEVRVEQHLSAADGVTVSKLSANAYHIEYDGIKTRFTLAKLDHESAGAPLLPGDHRVGRSHDESGTVFELVFSDKLNDFYFLLDPQNSPPDDLARTAPNTFVSRRTGFAYFKAPDSKRYVLVGVNRQETLVNSVFDGPFDHLPENDYADIGFWDYVYKAYPDMVGNHTPGGTVGKDGMIFSIRPYRLYDHANDLRFVEACAHENAIHSDQLACMIWGL
jgi:hypothetical protein